MLGPEDIPEPRPVGPLQAPLSDAPRDLEEVVGEGRALLELAQRGEWEQALRVHEELQRRLAEVFSVPVPATRVELARQVLFEALTHIETVADLARAAREQIGVDARRLSEGRRAQAAYLNHSQV